MKKYFYYMMMIVAVMGSAVLTSCGSDDDGGDTVDTTPITVNCGQSVDLSSRGTNISSANTFVATVTNKTMKAKHIGTTLLTVDGKQIPVTVNATVSYIDEPCTQWGATMAQVRAAQKSGTEIEPYKNADINIMYAVYSGSKIKYLYDYIFTNGKLTASSVLVPVSDASKLVDWLTERYEMLPISSSTSIAAGGYNANTLAESTTMCAISSETISNTYYNMYTKYCYLVMFQQHTN